MDNAIVGAIHGIGVNAWGATAAAPAFLATAGDVATARRRVTATAAELAAMQPISQIAPGSVQGLTANPRTA
ncbi:hypothetical protein [Hoyosella altamirensis]|uniref:Uncharacterized protein n=1 Tax=Hoyosella altamirensis TaxID=616997 RepID=A0A839RHD0_9ACTN|nr:hypothetical protein [Hoyosella altamirensis]MBB3035689.1 hypothetical protein [Hoyosella altamirensis]